MFKMFDQSENNICCFLSTLKVFIFHVWLWDIAMTDEWCLLTARLKTDFKRATKLLKINISLFSETKKT